MTQSLYFKLTPYKDLGERRGQVELLTCFCVYLVQNNPYNEAYSIVTLLSSYRTNNKKA